MRLVVALGGDERSNQPADPAPSATQVSGWRWDGEQCQEELRGMEGVCASVGGGLCGGERTAQPGQCGTEPNEFWNGGKSIFQPNVLAEQKAETIPTIIPTWEHRWGGKNVRAFGNNKFVDRNPATFCSGGYLPRQSLGFRDSRPMPPA